MFCYQMENSSVWKIFKKSGVESAICSLCSKTLSCKGQSTSGLLRHLQNVHKKRNEKESSTVAEQPTANKVRIIQSTMDQYAKKENLGSLVSKLAAIDGFTIKGIIRSIFIQESMKLRGYNLPKNESNVKEIIMEQFKTVKLELTSVIKKIRCQL